MTWTTWVGRLAARLAPAGAAFLPMPTLEDMRMTLIERVSEWPAEWRREGLERGREEGCEEGREHERALLRRMAASRFGAEVAERLTEVLARTADPDRLVEIGDWLARCETGGLQPSSVPGKALPERFPPGVDNRGVFGDDSGMMVARVRIA